MTRYDAFISYSIAADGQLAPQLQRGLEQLAKPWTQRRSLKVFRDVSGLAVSPRLWDSIVEALDDSAWFVVLASPEAAASVWVNREIEHWMASAPDARTRMLPVVTDGRWEWDDEAGGFTSDSSAVPDALRHAFDAEPRYLDLRWAHDSDHLELRNSRFRADVADLAAPIHGIPKDELESEDIRAHRRTVRVRRLAIGALATFAVVVAVLAVLALVLRERARDSEAVAVENEAQAVANGRTADARRLAAQSASIVTDETDLAALLAIESTGLEPTEEGFDSLALVMTSPIRSTVVPYDPDAVPLTDDGAPLGDWIDPAANHVSTFNPADPPIAVAHNARTGYTATLWQDGRLQLHEADDTIVLETSLFDVQGNAWNLAFSDDGRYLGVVGGNNTGWARFWDTSTIIELSMSLQDTEPLQGVAFSPDGRSVFTGGEAGVLRVWDFATGQLLAEWSDPSVCGDIGCLNEDWIFDLDVASDGTLAAGTGSGVIAFRSTRDPLVAIELPGDLATNRVQFDADDTLHAWLQGASVRTFELDQVPESTADHAAMAFAIDSSADSHVIATGGFDGNIVVTDDRSAQRWAFPRDATNLSAADAALLNDASLVFSVAVDPSGRYVASASVTLPTIEDLFADEPVELSSVVAVWDLQTNTAEIRSSVDAYDVAFTPDGLVAMAIAEGGLVELVKSTLYRNWPQRGRVDVWDPTSDAISTLTVLDEMAVGIDVSGDGKQVAVSTAGGSVHVFDRSSPPSFLQPDPVDGFGWALRVRFSDDGKTLAASGNTGQVVLWDLPGLSNPRIMVGHRGWVRGLVFIDDDAILVSAGSGDSALRYWDAARGTALGFPLSTDHAATDVTTGPDGTLIAATGNGRVSSAGRTPEFVRGDTGGRTVLPGPSSWSTDVCSVARRNLTNDEWSVYIGETNPEITCTGYPPPAD